MNRLMTKARMIPLHAKRDLRFVPVVASIAPSAVRLGKLRFFIWQHKAMSNSSTPSISGWVKYCTATEGRPPRPTLLAALDHFAAEGVCGTAVDLGCGDGRDAIELLRRGWHVIGIEFGAGGTCSGCARAKICHRSEARSARRDVRGSDVGTCRARQFEFRAAFLSAGGVPRALAQDRCVDPAGRTLCSAALRAAR